MYIFWFVLGGVMLLLYTLIEWKVILHGIKKTSGQEGTGLFGKRQHYVAGTAAVMFVAVSAFYFGFISYVRAEVQIVCWLLPSLLAAFLMGKGMSLLLRFVLSKDPDT
jgi:hypothetical protein